MSNTPNDFFKHKADVYEQNTSTVNNVDTISGAILKHIAFKPDMHIMDFGSGTGLLLEKIAPHVAHITAVDVSASMNEQLNKKRDSLDCELELLAIDLTQTDIDKTFDGIISSMTLHHIEDVQAIFAKFKALLKPGGFIALADLETEDGTFHKEDTGVFHFGFAKQALLDYATQAGFNHAEVTLASTVHKDYGDYPVLLLTATA